MSLRDEFMSYTGVTTPARQSRPRPVARPVTRPESQPVKEQPVLAPQVHPLELVGYSEKAFAIYGDTKPLADKLGQLGGRFNRFLKRDGVQTPGWIFSNSRKDAVRKAFNI